MRKRDQETVVIAEIRTGKMIEIISTIVFIGSWIGALIILATPMPTP
jgi:hypothetical protein